MKQLHTLALLILFGSLTASAQSNFATVEYKEARQPGLILQVPNKPGIAEGTILQKLKETGYNPETKGHLFWKKNKLNGFYVFNGVELPAMNNQKLDMYFKVEPKSRRDKNASVITMLVSKGYDNFVSPDTDTATFQAAKQFLNSFVAETVAYRLNLDVEGQANKVKDSEDRLAKLMDNEKDLERRIEQLQSDLIKNRSDQQNQQREIELEKKKLEELRSRQTQL